MIYLILGPFGLFILFRILLPLIWCTNFLISHEIIYQYYNIVFFHFIYLLFELFLVVLLMIYIVNTVARYRKYRQSIAYQRTKDIEGRKYAFIATIGVLIFLLFNYNTLPIFMEGGSNAIVQLGEEQKTKTWFMYGLLKILMVILSISVLQIKSKQKYIYIIILLAVSVISGKKSAFINFLSLFIFIYYIYSAKKPSLPFIKIGLGLLVSIVFIVFQFSRTENLDFEILDVFTIIGKLIYGSSTIYLEQLITQGGIEFIDLYSKMLGSFGSIIYLLNPFTKFLLGIGIYKGVGPFLGEMLYNYTMPYGVNPILYFEILFVYGSKFAIILSFIYLIIIFYLASIFIKKAIQNQHKSILVSTSMILLFLLCFAFTTDTLNAVRTLPFALLPLLVHYMLKMLQVISNQYKRINNYDNTCKY